MKTINLSCENDTYKFYRCDTYNDAVELKNELTDQGHDCAIGEDSRSWFVRVKK